MLHEAVHQLNHEVARLHIPKWADEGLAEYFSTSRIRDGSLVPGLVDPDTYPVWWVPDMPLSGNLREDIESGRIIPLRAIVSGDGGPDMDESFNLYYIHWWSLAHFLFHGGGGRYREAFLREVRDGGSLESFERHIGPVDQIQAEWYAYLLELRERTISGWDRPGAGDRQHER